MEDPPIFLDHILGELIHEENQEENPGRSEEELKKKNKEKKKKIKKIVSSGPQPESSFGVPKRKVVRSLRREL